MRRSNWIGSLAIVLLLAACHPAPQVTIGIYNATQVILTEPPAVTVTPSLPVSSVPESLVTGTQAAYPGLTPIISAYPGQTVYPTLDPTSAEETRQAENAASTADTALRQQTATAEEAARPTSASVATSTPAPVPTRLVVNSKPDCVSRDLYTHCHDNVLAIDFDYPSAWGAISAQLIAGEYAGYAYIYVFHTAQDHAGASGAGADFSEPGRDVGGYFAGFLTDPKAMASPQASCVSYGAAICQMIQPNILFMLSLPAADRICDPAPGVINTAWGYIAVNLPRRPQINGFLFISTVLSGQLDHDLGAILGVDYGAQQLNCKDPAARHRFDAKVQEIIAAIQNGTVDAGTKANIDQLLHLAESIRFD